MLFEHAQGYVALSRVTNISGLKLINLDVIKFTVSAESKAEYERLRAASAPTVSEWIQQYGDGFPAPEAQVECKGGNERIQSSGAAQVPVVDAGGPQEGPASSVHRAVARHSSLKSRTTRTPTA